MARSRPGWRESYAIIPILARQADMSLAGLAVEAGVSTGYLYRVIRGLQTPSWPVMCCIADALGVSVEELRQSPHPRRCIDCERRFSRRAPGV